MNSGTARPAGRREWIGLAVIALPCVVYAMDLTVLNLAVPHLSADLRPSSTQLLWIVDIYGFMVSGLLVTMGTLGDRIGRRRLLLAARDTLGGAAAAAGQLPDRLGQALLSAARQALTEGLHLAFAVSAGAAVGVAVLAVALLRQENLNSQPGSNRTPGHDQGRQPSRYPRWRQARASSAAPAACIGW